MCGEENSPILTDKDGPVVRIPLYRELRFEESVPAKEVDERLVVSASVANGAEFAMPYTDDILNPYLRNSVLLLREHKDEEILYGNIYLIATEKTRMFRIVQEDKNPETLRLKALQPSVFNDILIHRDRIVSMWLAVGAVCNMGR